jgi:hypothetical protein
MAICTIISLYDRFHACAYKKLKHILLVHINAASAIAANAKGGFVRDLILGCNVIAAFRMKGRFSRCAATLRTPQMQQFPRCERTQQENAIHTSGSKRSFLLSHTTSKQLCHPRHIVSVSFTMICEISGSEGLGG